MSNHRCRGHSHGPALRGLLCPSWVAKIEGQVGRVDGVAAVRVHLAFARIEIDHGSALVRVDELVAANAQAGCAACPAVL